MEQVDSQFLPQIGNHKITMSKKEIANPQNYWQSYEAERSVYYISKWNVGARTKELLESQEDFVTSFLQLCLDHNLLIPQLILDNENKRINWKETNSLKGFTAQFLRLYYVESKDTGVFNSLIYFDKDHSDWIVNIDPFIKREERSMYNEISCPPLSVNFLSNSFDSSLDLIVSFDHDAFFSEVDNKKTRRDSINFSEDTWMNNKISHSLNGERVNNFILKLKDLCYEFGANDCSVDSSFNEDDINEEGIIL